MIKVASLLFPLAGTASLFSVLFNNTYHGLAILATLLIPNLVIALIPAKRFPAVFSPEYARSAALCVIALLVTTLGIEILYPMALPQRFHEIQELSKGFTESPAERFAGQQKVFTNAEQHIRFDAGGPTSGEAGLQFWHSPGRQFDYYGYDANSKTSYVNRFVWNSKGYFDNDYNFTRPTGVRRVVVIGDSYVEAVQVPLARTFHKILEKELNRSAVDAGLNSRIEVIALGSSGTGQVENLKVLEEKAVRYDPDMVIMTLCSNDFCDDDPELKQELILAAGGITPLVRRLVSHGYMAMAFAAKRFQDLRRNREAVSPELLQWSRADIPKVEAAWSRTLSCVRASNDFCRARGIEFVLVYLGSDVEVKYALDPVATLDALNAMGGPHAEMKWDLGKSLRRISSFAENNDIVFTSLLDPLIAAQKEAGEYVFGDHYTMFGHQVVASVLSRAVDFRLHVRLADQPEVKQAAASKSTAMHRAGSDQTVPHNADAIKLK